VRFPFLDPFLTDAQAFWMQPGSGVLRSGVWSETDASGGECYFEASAVSLGVCRLLLIERLGSAYREKQHLIQTGREINLRLGKQERAAGTLALTNADLERRVAHGTVELARATERLQALSHRLMGAQEAERRHIARELHDEIGQSLTAVILSLRMTQETLGAGPVASSLQDSIALVERVLQQARDLSLDLRPSLLDDLGLAAALRWHMDRHARRGGLSTTVTTDVLEPRPGPEIEITCFRVAQEALTNIIRHARATHVTVELRVRPAEIELVVRDDGVGFDVIGARRRATGGQSLGLLGMEERLLLAGGRLDIESAPGRGTVIRAHLPRRPLTFSAQDMGDG
jgi:signal transduction histidine kinase